MTTAQLNEIEVQASLRQYEKLFEEKDTSKIMEGFADDTVLDFAGLGVFEGKEAVTNVLGGFFTTVDNYKISKTLEVLSGDKFTTSYTATWTDPSSGQKMAGKGIEILTVKDGLFSHWRVNFTEAEAA